MKLAMIIHFKWSHPTIGDTILTLDRDEENDRAYLFGTLFNIASTNARRGQDWRLTNIQVDP